MPNNAKKWDEFLKDVFDDDQERIDLLAEWFGYNLVPDMQYERLMFCTGRPRSGKGTVANALIAMLGRYQCTSTSFQSLSSGFGCQDLIGKLAVLMCDERVAHRAQAISALEKILKIVGRDQIGVQRKFLTDITMDLTCRFTIVMNDLPDLPDSSNALGPRLNVIFFGNSYFGREDPTLKPRLEQEAREGKLVNFALRGLKRLRENGRFTMPVSSRTVINQMKEITTPVSSFIRDCCVLQPPRSEEDYHMIVRQAYEAWVCWCNDTGIFKTSEHQFGRDLFQVCPKLIKHRIRVGDGGRQAVYEGIRLTEEAKNRYLGRN